MLASAPTAGSAASRRARWLAMRVIFSCTRLTQSALSTKAAQLPLASSSSCDCRPVVHHTVRGTRYVRHARGWYAYSARTVAHQLPCASGAYSAQEAGTRSPYVQYRGPGAYV